MTSSRKTSTASTFVTEKRISQWEELMRKFSEAHKDQCKATPLKMPRAERSIKYFPTGSKYEGSWDVLGMSGYGVYTFPNGVIYEGDFEDGVFHGNGQYRYESGVILRGKFVNGVMTERKILFGDVEYTENDWKYCSMPDRRFDIEYDLGLNPAGQSYLTAEQPTREIPPGYYDTGDGFYDPKTKVIYKYEDLTTIVRSPSALEQQWIVKNCRVNPIEPLGPCPDLYEKYLEPILTPQRIPPPTGSVKSTMSSFFTQSMHEDFNSAQDCMKPYPSPLQNTFYVPSQGMPSDKNRRGSTIKRKSKYENIMKEFSEKHKEKCKGEVPQPAPCTFTTKNFPTGSSYEGQYEDMNMRGYGEYTFPNGVLYRGEFESNMCHGDGELVYDDGSEEFTVIRGKWVKGIMSEGQVFFSGVLEHNRDNWKYCKMPDRRYVTEFNKELKPAGLSNITPEQPSREIPAGFRNTGYGFYNPKTKVVYKYHNILEVVKAPSEREQKWIEHNCRMEPVGKIGPRKDFYKPWLEPDVDPPPLPQLLVGYDPRCTHSEFQLDVEESMNKPLFYDSSKTDFKSPPRKFQPAKK